MPDAYAVDFETFYDKEYSLKKMSTWNYVYDERFDAYLVAVHGKDLHWVGHPKDFDWSKLDGKLLIMHNASFDGLVIQRLQEDGVIDPSLELGNLFDTADLAVWLSAPRSLKGATETLLKREMSKDMRDFMKGRTYAQAKAEGKEEDLIQYGGGDAVNTYDLWDQYADQWPEKEQVASRINRESGWRGVAVDKALVQQGLATLKQKLFDVESSIPWIDEGYKPTSPQAVRIWGRKAGIPVPASLAKDKPEVIAWQKEYGPDHPWIQSVGEWRSVNTLLNRVQSIESGTRADGTMPYACKYFGASTGRFSGGGEAGGKFNMLNMPRKDMFGVDIRPMFVARPGHKLIVLDYAQIEARMLLWRVGDVEFLNILEEEGNLYQAYAKKVGYYKGNGSFKKDDPSGYHYIKCCVLGLGYGCGAARFKDMAATSYGIELDDGQAISAVQGFRGNNPLITKHWWGHQVSLKLSANAHDKTHEVELRSGRDLVYFDPQFAPGGRDIRVRFERGANLRKVYGGLMTENEIQATARDVLIDGMYAIDKHTDYPHLWSVYDEVVAEVPEAKAQDAAKELEHYMVNSSPWADGSLLEVEYDITDHYLK